MPTGAAALPFPSGTCAPQLRSSVERLRGGLLWLTGCAGAFVFMEPSPYEVASLLTIAVFAATGLSLRAAIMPLVVLLILYNVGFSFAVIPVLSLPKTGLWVLVSWYMAATAVFFAAMLGTSTQSRLDLLVRGYMMAALIAAVAGIIGYFRLVPFSDLFLMHERARGTFNDPNVLGAFLVFPSLIALQRMLGGGLAQALRGGALLLLFTIAVLLSFSRAAWGQFAVCLIVMLALTFVTSRSGPERLRIGLIAATGLMAMTLFIAALLSLDAVAELFKERASLGQSYDSGPMGRFGRHVLGFFLAMDHPLGIGPLQFARIFPEDPHNAYLNAFLSGGWLSGFCYATLALVTLALGARFIFAPTPWQNTYLAVLTAFAGLAIESLIIDTDHWRHYFLLLGLLWGLMAASSRYLASTRSRAVVGSFAPINRKAKPSRSFLCRLSDLSRGARARTVSPRA
jgi:hypothetical protein